MSDTVTTPAPPELKTMRFEIDGTVGTLTLSRPDDMNAMSPEMIAELAADRPLARRPGADPRPDRHRRGPRVLGRRRRQLVPRGLDDPDVDLVAAGPPRRRRPPPGDRRLQADPLPGDRARSTAPPPAPASRWRSCATSGSPPRTAFFVCAYGRIGASPDGGMTYFLPRVIGPAAATELMLEDPNLTAADALERGLVSEVVAADELLAAAGAKAAELAAKSPHYQRMVKRLVWQSLDNSLADHLQIERHGIAESMGTEDLQQRRPRLPRRRAAELQRPLSGGGPCAAAGRSSARPGITRGEEEHLERRDFSMSRLLAAVAALGARGPGARRLRGQRRRPSTTAADTTETQPRPRPRRRRRRDRHLRGRSRAAQLAYVETDVSAKAGNDTIEFDNPSSTGHDVVIEDESGGEVAKTDVITDSTTTTTADLQPGTYTFYCSVPGHREAGMEGTLTVK